MVEHLAQFQVSRFGCPVCGQPSLSLAAKKKHIKSMHPKPKAK